MQRKVRVPDNIWDAFCASLPVGVGPSDRIREMIEQGINPLENIMDAEEAAELWDLSPGYIKNLCASGKVLAKKKGKTWILDKNQSNPKKN